MGSDFMISYLSYNDPNSFHDVNDFFDMDRYEKDTPQLPEQQQQQQKQKQPGLFDDPYSHFTLPYNQSRHIDTPMFGAPASAPASASILASVQSPLAETSFSPASTALYAWNKPCLGPSYPFYGESLLPRGDQPIIYQGYPDYLRPDYGFDQPDGNICTQTSSHDLCALPSSEHIINVPTPPEAETVSQPQSDASLKTPTPSSSSSPTLAETEQDEPDCTLQSDGSAMSTSESEWDSLKLGNGKDKRGKKRKNKRPVQRLAKRIKPNAGNLSKEGRRRQSARNTSSISTLATASPKLTEGKDKERISIRRSHITKSTLAESSPDSSSMVDKVNRSAGRSKNFPCIHSGCSQVCKTAGDLKRHLESRAHKDPSYTCLSCNKPYTRTDALTRHHRHKPECKKKHASLAPNSFAQANNDEDEDEDGDWEIDSAFGV